MSDFQTVAKVGDIPIGEARAYQVNGKMVAVFNVDGEYSAINDLCPHMGASLASGYVEKETVTCPWHAWRFCITDGTWMDNPNAKVKTDCYAIRVEGNEIQVDVPPARSTEDDLPTFSSSDSAASEDATTP
jgi:nitrite reductase (NADH) small subunit/3-phenylpropionate/trans-cinnamate dioxygenase ferredoxin subunit